MNMFKMKITGALIITLILTVINLYALSNAYAEAGGMHGGGGLAVGDDLLDVIENSQKLDLRKFDPTTTQAFKEKLYPRLQKLDQRIPGIANYILSGFKEKNWYFTNSKIKPSNDSCYLIDLNEKQVARQDDNDVVILESWFKTPPKDHKDQLLAKQEALLLHELIMANERNPEDCSKGVREAVRLILTTDEKTDEQLRDGLIKAGYSAVYFLTPKEFSEAFNLLNEKVFIPTCMQNPPTKEQATIALNALDMLFTKKSGTILKYYFFNYDLADPNFSLRDLLFYKLRGSIGYLVRLSKGETYEDIIRDDPYGIKKRFYENDMKATCDNLQAWITHNASAVNIRKPNVQTMQNEGAIKSETNTVQ